MSTVFRVGDPIVVVDAAGPSVVEVLGCVGTVVSIEDTGIYDVGVHFPEDFEGDITDFYDFELAIDEAKLLEV